MKIDVECSRCGKLYQVDESVAGKKSRCRDCGNVFRIPLAPGAFSSGDSSRGSSADSGSRSLSNRAVLPPPDHVLAPASPPVTQSAAALEKIVFNCPRCFKRYEVDAALTGKKSRCKDCKEVFTIPAAPLPPPPPREPDLVPRKPPLGTRNFVVIPEEVRAEFDEEDELEFEPERVVRRAPQPVLEEEPLELAPRRVAYPERPGLAARRKDVDTEVGLTVAGAYSALGILAFIVLALWHAAGEPGSDKLARVFGASLLILYVLGVVMATWGSIWLLVIAFRDKLEQGLFCLLIPYAIYYIFSRWRETRGIFAMCVAPSVLIVFFALFGGLVLGIKSQSSFLTGVSDRLQSLAPELIQRPNPNKQAVALQVYHDYIQAMNRYSEDLARIEPSSAAQMTPGEFQMRVRESDRVEKDFVVALNLAKMVKMNPVDVVAVKKSIGAEMRAALIALKFQFTRLASLPGIGQRLDGIAADLEQTLAAWESPDDDGQMANLFPGSTAAPGHAPAGMPPSGRPPGVPPAGRPQGFESVEAGYDQMRSQYGEKAVMLVLTGLPINTDAALGVTRRDVEDAIDKKLKALAPGAAHSISSGSGDNRSICLAPVDDVKGLSDGIDFGTATRQGSRIDVVVSAGFIASAPRLPAQPAMAARSQPPREKEPDIPANADPVTKSLIQLTSSNNFQKNEALERLARITPNDRLKEVLEKCLPLLEHDDQDLVKHAARVLAVWQSPEAMAKLIERASDNRVFVRWDIIKALAKYDDPKAVEVLIGRLKEDGHQAEEALQTMGSVAELPLIELLTNPDADLRKKACEILKFTGGGSTLNAMKSMRPDPEFFVRVAAKRAQEMISLRVGSTSGDASKSKKAAPQPSARTKKKS